MNLPAHFLPFHGRKQLSTLASDLASRCSAAVWDRGGPRAVGMTPSEAKGYLRALATAAVSDRLTDDLLRSRGLAESAAEEIIALAAEGVVERLVGEVVRWQRAQAQRRAA
jgi:hypothetical protein